MVQGNQREKRTHREQSPKRDNLMKRGNFFSAENIQDFVTNLQKYVINQCLSLVHVLGKVLQNIRQRFYTENNFDVKHGF